MKEFNDIFNELKNEVTDLAKSNLKEMQNEAIADSGQFLNALKDDMKNWSLMLVNGEISNKDFESLVRGKKSLAVMTALKQKGLTQVRVDKFVNGIIDIIVGKVFDSLKK